MKTLKDLDLKGKRVLMRVDFNVPLDEELKVVDDTRIQAALPSINYVLEQGGKLILMAHLGRPKGEFKEELRLEPVAKKLNEVVEPQVEYVNDCIGEKVEDAIKEMKEGELLLLENIRFYKEEKDNDSGFAEKLSKLADVFVNDGFGVSHRAHASVVGVAEKMEEKAAGMLLEKEIENLGKILSSPEKPVVTIIGGAKISTKIGLISKMLEKSDYVLLGGALANTVLLAQGSPVGKSLVEEEELDKVKDLDSEKLLVPIDVVVAKEIKGDVATDIKGVDEVVEDDIILDIGPDTVKKYAEIILKAKTVVWNGPLGMFELEKFAGGTQGVAQAVVDSDSFSVIGGGETVDAVKKTGMADQVSFISTGGGAMLEFLEGKELPGIKVIK